MDPNYLLKDELEFELQSRGVEVQAVVSVLRKLLRELLVTEQSGSTSYKIKAPTSVRSAPDRELVTCESKLKTLSAYIDEIIGKPDRHLFRRLVSRLYHIKNRLSLICPIELDDDTYKAKLTEECNLLLQRLEAKDDDGDCSDDEVPFSVKQALQETLGELGEQIVKKLEGVSFEDDRSITKPENMKTTKPKFVRSSTAFEDDLPKRKLVPISQWGVSFSGDKHFSVNAFIERVNELKDARNATNEDLWRYAIDFFKGDALVWLRANKNYATNWEEFLILLKRTFQSPFYQEELLAEIKERTQGKDESITVYISVMQNMFNRLPTKIPEQETIMIILRNLQPYYQKAVCRDLFTSIADLIQVLTLVERTKISCDRFVEPKVQKNYLEPDLAYKNSSSPFDSREINEVDTQSEVNNVTNTKATNIKRCWNCRETGHLFRSCAVPKQRLFCYKCGRFGVTSKDCECKGNASGEGTNPAK
uniref:CCHC-type domain-containing protein n=1 Tax=Pectinophora gossypiella TaxID=13191 RepID=A0A1E1WIZ0_PECGO